MPGVELGSAFVPIHADLDPLKKDLDQAEGGIKASLGKIASVAAGVGAGLVAAFAAAGVAAFKLGESFDGAYDTIRASTGKTGEALEDLKGDFKAVVQDVPTDFATASSVVAELNKRTGATGETLQDLSKSVLEFSRITGTDAVTNVASATRMFGDWSVATEDQAGTLDKVFRASQATGLGVQELMGKVVQFGAPLRAMGFSLDESAAMLGKWEKEGVNTELVLGSMRIAMGKFADAGIPAREGLEATIAKIQDLGPSAEATALAMDTFGARAGPDMAAAILEGRFALGDLVEQIANGSETIEGAAGDTADGAERMQLAMNRLSVALEPVATGVFNVVGLLVEKLAPAIESAVQGLAPFIAVLGAELVPAVERVFEWIGQLAQGWQKATASVTNETSTLWRFIQPIFDALARNLAVFWEEVFPELQRTWEVVVGRIQNTTAQLAAFWEEHWDTISKVLDVAVTVITALIDTTFSSIKTLVKVVLNVMQGDWEGAWNAIRDHFGVVWQAIQRVVSAALPLIQEALSSAWARIQEEFSRTWTNIKTALTGALDTLSTMFRNAGPALLGLLKQGLDAAWGGVIANVQAGVGRIAALLPHSYAEEGPLSKPVSWRDVLWGDLRTVMPETVAVFAVGAELIESEWESLRTVMKANREAISSELAALQADFAETVEAASAAASAIASAGVATAQDVNDHWGAVSSGSLSSAIASYQNQTNAAMLNAMTAATGIGPGGQVGAGIIGGPSVAQVNVEIDGQTLAQVLAPLLTNPLDHVENTYVPF